MRSRNCLARAIPTFAKRYRPHLVVFALSFILHFQAALCALRIIKKVPDLSDHFITKAKNLLTDRNHGVLLTAITLVSEMCQQDENCLNEFRNVGPHLLSLDTLSSRSTQAVPLLVRNMKALATTGYSPEHDVSGITDPFLQVKVLRLLRFLGQGDVRASETMNDILAQVRTPSTSLSPPSQLSRSLQTPTPRRTLETRSSTKLSSLSLISKQTVVSASWLLISLVNSSVIVIITFGIHHHPRSTISFNSRPS